MKYALNTAKGTTIDHPDVKLPGGVAVPVDDHVANQVKHVVGVIIFDRIHGRKEDKGKESKPLYGINTKNLNKDQPIKTVDDKSNNS